MYCQKGLHYRFAAVLMFAVLSLISTLHAESGQKGVRQLDFEQKLREGVKTRSLSKFQKDYFTIESVTVRRVKTDADTLHDFENYVYRRDSDKDLGDTIMVIEKLLALGKKIWKIVEDGKPVVNTDFATPVSVLPQTEDGPRAAFHRMANWQAPKVRTFRVSYENALGIQVIEFDYSVTYQYGGTYEGKGAYLTGVDVSASNLSVSWGFEFNAKSQLMNISNRGALEDPLAAATMRIDYSASSVLRSISTSEKFHVMGNGEITHL